VPISHDLVSLLTGRHGTVVHVKIQYLEVLDYEAARRAALANGKSAEFDLLDSNGRVMRSFQQVTTLEPDESAYRSAMHPPRDDSMERAQRTASTRARPRQRIGRNRRPVWSQGAVSLDYEKTPPRPRGTILEW
jgi:hypothetical protein